MSESPTERWPWLTIPRALAIGAVCGVVFYLLAWYFNGDFWRDLKSFVQTKNFLQ